VPTVNEELMMRLKKTAAVGAIAAALLGGAVAGPSLAQAKPHDPCIAPGNNCWLPGDPPGHNPWGPPGQVMQGNPDVLGLTGVPPGHWGETWAPWIGAPELPVVWNNDLLAWGVWWLDQFIPAPWG
jgi:hypothetical protein